MAFIHYNIILNVQEIVDKINKKPKGLGFDFLTM